MTLSERKVVVYGRELCADTTRARAVLDARAVPYEYVDVAADDASRSHAAGLAGSANIPVLLFGDGTVLVEPSDAELIAALR